MKKKSSSSFQRNCITSPRSNNRNFRNFICRFETLSHSKNTGRIAPLPPAVLQELARYLMEYPEMRGKVFKIEPRNFRRTFYEFVVKAGIPKEKAHPHILRHISVQWSL